MKFSFEKEKNGKLSFLDVEVSPEGNKFTTTIYHKSTFSGAYTHFDSFLPTYKFCMIYTLVFRYFSVFSNWTKEYPLSFIDKCFKTLLDRFYLKPPQILTAEKKTPTLVLLFLGKLSLQKVLKRTLSCSKYR